MKNRSFYFYFVASTSLISTLNFVSWNDQQLHLLVLLALVLFLKCVDKWINTSNVLCANNKTSNTIQVPTYPCAFDEKMPWSARGHIST